MYITPARAIDDPNLLGRGFVGPSWNRWRAILRAAFGEPLNNAERHLFRTVAERDPPRQPVKELWIIGGRRGGKDSVASAIAATAALGGDFADRLRPGEKASVLCLATDRDQAKIVLRYITAFFAE